MRTRWKSRRGGTQQAGETGAHRNGSLPPFKGLTRPCPQFTAAEHPRLRSIRSTGGLRCLSEFRPLKSNGVRNQKPRNRTPADPGVAASRLQCLQGNIVQNGFSSHMQGIGNESQQSRNPLARALAGLSGSPFRALRLGFRISTGKPS